MEYPVVRPSAGRRVPVEYRRVTAALGHRLARQQPHGAAQHAVQRSRACNRRETDSVLAGLAVLTVRGSAVPSADAAHRCGGRGASFSSLRSAAARLGVCVSVRPCARERV